MTTLATPPAKANRPLRRFDLAGKLLPIETNIRAQNPTKRTLTSNDFREDIIGTNKSTRSTIGITVAIKAQERNGLPCLKKICWQIVNSHNSQLHQ